MSQALGSVGLAAAQNQLASAMAATDTALMDASAAAWDQPASADTPPPASSVEIAPPPAPRTARPLIPAILAGVAALTPATTALAQAPGIDQLAAISPSLPPSWQMIVGGLLYVQPAVRLVSRIVRRVASWFSRPAASEAPVSAQPKSLADKVNLATGHVERVIGPVRDWGALGLGIYTGAKIALGGHPIADYVPEALAFGLSFWSWRDRTHRVEKTMIDNQIADETLLKPADWRAHKARGIGVIAPDVPRHFAPQETLGTDWPKNAENAEPGFSLARNLGGQATTLAVLFETMFAQHMHYEGTSKTMLNHLTTLFIPGRCAPISEKYLPVAELMLRQWVLRMCENYGITLNFEMDRLKEIPEGAPVVASGFPHASIYTDFFYWLYQPKSRPLADKVNFHDHIIMRLIYLSAFLDQIGLPYAVRPTPPGWFQRILRRLGGKKTNGTPSSIPPPMATGNGNGNGQPNGNGNGGKETARQMADRILKHRIEPIVYTQGGREPATFDEQGDLDEASFYGNVIKPDKPERWQNPYTLLETAVAVAKQSGRDAYIPVLIIDGASKIMPKISKTPPFIQRVQPGTITFRVGGIVRVAPDANMTELADTFTRTAKEATGINALLRRRVAQWAEDNGRPEASAAFAAAAETNEVLYVIADRIRSVHPSFPQRNEFKRRLLEIAAAGDSEENLKSLLKDVSKFVKDHQYEAGQFLP